MSAAFKTRNKQGQGQRQGQRQKQKTIHSLFSQNMTTLNLPNFKVTGSSVAARQTTILWNNIAMDMGMIAPETDFTVGLITHGHDDHSRGITQAYSQDGEKILTIFCPASIAESIVNTIKNSYQMGKGRNYSYAEIMKHLVVYGVKKAGDENFDGETKIVIDETQIATLIEMGEIVKVNLKGRERCAIQPFPCYHTVDTCGYMIYTISEKLCDNVVIDEGDVVKVNMTEDQDPKKKRSKNKNNNKNKNKTEDTDDKTETLIAGNDDNKFKEIYDFATRHDVDIVPTVESETLESGYVLKVRTLTFPNGMNLQAKADDKCILTSVDFNFLNKYKIDYRYDELSPEVMFFGDTCSYVFKDPLVKKLMQTTKRVIVESTFLEGKGEMGEKKYRKRLDKRHMFLPELVPIFTKHPDVTFILIHFSACYDVPTIKSTVKTLQKNHPNVTALI